jgi:hypothetical protein
MSQTHHIDPTMAARNRPGITRFAVGVAAEIDFRALSATFLALSPCGRAVTLKDLFHEEAERFAAANLP